MITRLPRYIKPLTCEGNQAHFPLELGPQCIGPISAQHTHGSPSLHQARHPNVVPPSPPNEAKTDPPLSNTPSLTTEPKNPGPTSTNRSPQTLRPQINQPNTPTQVTASSPKSSPTPPSGSSDQSQDQVAFNIETSQLISVPIPFAPGQKTPTPKRK
ncbi:hypothetical protein Salat_1596100 [Sesamum alatum]|uniref:Uncharacterized protein n=1 Tax=Sesamum alatum TaxID=300844 RepID=A0AAE1Y5X7_9LAMI|nr:hypothetical protein Salat_1596100 [Sesamum alatum]